MERRIQAVLFDLDDTLIDWSKQTLDWKTYYQRCTGNVFEFLLDGGYVLPGRDKFHDIFMQHIRDEWGKVRQSWIGGHFSHVLTHTLTACNLNPAEFDLDELMRVFNWFPMPGVTTFDDTHDVLRQLQADGYKMGLITNSYYPMWMRNVEMEAYDLNKYFDVALTSGDVGYYKPHPQVYHHTLDLLGIKPENAIYIGDRPANDVKGANEAGMISVFIYPPHITRELNGVEPDFTITTLSELLPILKQLERD